MTKEIHMTADEFKEHQSFLGHDNATMATELRRSKRAVDEYRRHGLTDMLVVDRVLFLVAEKQAEATGEACVTGCGAIAETGKAYCRACACRRTLELRNEF